METFELLNRIAGYVLLAGLLGLLGLALRSIRIVPNRNAYIVERLGRYHGTLEAGLHFLVPVLDKVVYKLSLKEESIPVPPQECFTRDTVRVMVEAEIFMSVTEPARAAYGVSQYRYAAIQLAQTTIRAVIGELELDEVIEERAKIKKDVVERLSEVQEDWGIRVHRYEVKRVVPPQTVNDAMERQNNATRRRDGLLKESTGKKESLIKRSEGQKQELVNLSEGNKQRRINQAQGKAAEIKRVADATAQSIEQLAEAARQTGGQDALRLQVARQYFSTLSQLGRSSTRVVLPSDLTDFEGLVQKVDPVAASGEPSSAPRRTGGASRSSYGSGRSAPSSG